MSIAVIINCVSNSQRTIISTSHGAREKKRERGRWEGDRGGGREGERGRERQGGERGRWGGRDRGEREREPASQRQRNVERDRERAETERSR